MRQKQQCPHVSIMTSHPRHLFLGNRQWPLLTFGQYILVGNVPTYIPRVARPPIDQDLDQLSSYMSQQYDKYTPTILNTSTVFIASCKFTQQVADGSFTWDHMRYCLAPSVNNNLCSEQQQFTSGCHEAWTDPVQLQLQHCSRQFLTCTWFIMNQYNMGSHNSTPPKHSHRSY